MDSPLLASNPMQGTSDWLSARCGCATASRMNDILDITAKGAPGAKRVKYLKDIIAERMTGNSVTHVITAPMRDGLEREPYARAEYEARTGNIVTLVGFVPHPSIEYAGSSPDGCVGRDGLIEIKAPTDTVHVGWLMAGVVPTEHVAQMTFQLACTRRTWCDFVSFNPNMKDPKRRLFIRRFVPTPEQIADLEAKVRAFLAEVDRAFDLVHTD